MTAQITRISRRLKKKRVGAHKVWFGGNILTEIPSACFPGSATPIAANVVCQWAARQRVRRGWYGANNSTGTPFVSLR